MFKIELRISIIKFECATVIHLTVKMESPGKKTRLNYYHILGQFNAEARK